MFVLIGDYVVNVNSISRIDFSRLEELVLTVHFEDRTSLPVVGIQTIELLMAIKPSAYEGRRMMWYRHAWAFHNLVAHPLMQILAFFKQYKLAIKIHDYTVPRPINRRHDVERSRKYQRA